MTTVLRPVSREQRLKTLIRPSKAPRQALRQV